MRTRSSDQSGRGRSPGRSAAPVPGCRRSRLRTPGRCDDGAGKPRAGRSWPGTTGASMAQVLKLSPSSNIKSQWIPSQRCSSSTKRGMSLKFLRNAMGRIIDPAGLGRLDEGREGLPRPCLSIRRPADDADPHPALRAPSPRGGKDRDRRRPVDPALLPGEKEPEGRMRGDPIGPSILKKESILPEWVADRFPRRPSQADESAGRLAMASWALRGIATIKESNTPISTGLVRWWSNLAGRQRL